MDRDGHLILAVLAIRKLLNKIIHTLKNGLQLMYMYLIYVLYFIGVTLLFDVILMMFFGLCKKGFK